MQIKTADLCFTCKEKIHKTLKIVHKPYGNTYTIGLNLQGKYLERFGFEFGDMVNVEISKNRILIEKIVLETPELI